MCERERERMFPPAFLLSVFPYFLRPTLPSFHSSFFPSFVPPSLPFFNPSLLPSLQPFLASFAFNPSFLQPFLPSSPSTLPRFLPSPIVCADAITCREKRPGDPRATSRFARRPEGFSCLLRAPLSLSMVPPAFFAS